MGVWSRVKKEFDRGNDLEDALKAAVYEGLSSAAQKGWEGTKAVADEVMNLDHPKEWIGDLNREMTRLPLDDTGKYLKHSAGPESFLYKTGILQTDKEDRARIRDIADSGGSGRDVWESNQGQLNQFNRAANDILIDPTTWLSLGGAGAGKALITKGTATAAKGGLRAGIAGTAEVGAGRILKATTYPDQLMDKYVATSVGKLANTKPGRYFLGRSERALHQEEMDILDALLRQTIREEGRPVTSYQTGFDQGSTAAGSLLPTKTISDIDLTIAKLRQSLKADLPLNKRKINFDAISDKVYERGPHALKDDAGNPMPGLKSAFEKAMTDSEADIQWLGNFAKKIKDHTLPDGRMKKGITRKEYLQRDEILNRYGLVDMFDPDLKLKMRENALRNELEADPTIPWLTEEENARLHDRLIDSGTYKGKSNLQVFNELRSKYVANRQLIKSELPDGPDPWDAGMWDFEKFAYLMTKPEAKKAYKFWTDINVDPLHTTDVDAAVVALKREIYRDTGLEAKYKGSDNKYIQSISSFFGDLAATWKGAALVSGRYHTQNILGNYFNTIIRNGVDGLKMIPRLSEIWKEVGGAWTDPSLEHQIRASTIVDTAYDFGFAPVKSQPGIPTGAHLNANVSSMGSSSMIGGRFDAAEKLFKRLGMRPVGKGVGKVINKNRAVSLGIDTAARGSIWQHSINAKFEELAPKLTSDIMDYANKVGVDITGVSPLPFKDPLKAQGYYRGLGFSQGQAEHLSRMVAKARNEADKFAIGRVQKTLFSYYKSPFDEAIGKIIPFHYYATRATAMYAEELMRSPLLLFNFSRMMAELNDADDSGLNARQKGWVRIMGGPMGYSLLMNPDALLGVTRGLGLMTGGGGYETDETELGGILKWMKTGGFGLYPWFDGMFNMVGAYGDTFEPDMLGIRHRAIVGSAINLAMAELGRGMPDAWYAGMNAKAREISSGWASQLLPGWMSQKVVVKANRSGTIAEATIEKAIENRIITNNPDLTYDQLFDIMNDPDSDEYQKAWLYVARSGFATQLLSFTLPVGVKVRDDAQDVRDAMVTTVYQYGAEHDGDYDPTGDAEFAAYYKQATGHEWSMAAFNDAQMKRDLASSTDKARPFILAEYNYKRIGTPRAIQARDIYNAIKYDGFIPKGYSAPAKGDEELLADRWLSNQPRQVQMEYKDMKDLQEAFKASHPEYAAYTDWRGQISYLVSLVGDSGYSIYRERVSQGNPNAARYFQSVMIEAKRRFPGDVKKATEWMNQKTTSPDAWMAIVGIPARSSSPRPLDLSTPTGIPYDPAQPMIEQATPWNDNASSGPSAPVSKYDSFLQNFQ